MNDRESERLDSTEETGTELSEDPVEESETPHHGPDARKDDPCSEMGYHVSTKQYRIAETAKRSPEMAFTSLAHLMDIAWLREAYHRTRKDGAVGIDGQTAKAYEASLEDNFQSLLDRVKSGTYQCTGSSPGAHTEGTWLRNPTDWDSDLRRQIAPAGGTHAPGAHL